MKRRTNAVIAAIVSGALISAPIFAKASDLDDLVGARASGGESQLQSRGYEHYTTHKDDYSSHAFWWNANRKDCVQVDTENGRFSSIVDVSDGDCGHKDNTAAVVAAVAGVALIAALIATRKKDKDYESYSSRQRSEYDRGFRDGYSRNRMNNYSRSDIYERGYREGMRANNNGNGNGNGYQGRPNYGRPSYSSPAQINDLNGARAAGAMDTLSRRGFRQVDNFTSGNTRYSIQWRGSSRQCVQVTIANGRVANIRDIRTHPRCN